jgi:hypothetical protein
MVIFPIIALIVSVACAAVVGRDAWRRPSPDRVAWTLAFGIFAVAAGAEVAGSLGEWSAPLVRIYYLCGAVLVVGYLALGEGYLLARKRIERVAPGLTMLVTALVATLVINAPIDEARLADDGWDAIERGPALVAMTVGINTIGTVVLVGGALYSAWKFRRLGIQRHRMIGCVLIALGTITVAMGGTLTRFGQREYLYIAMSIGVAIIFAGVLQTRRPEPAADAGVIPSAATVSIDGAFPANGRARLVALPHATGAAAPHDQALEFIETRLLPLPADELSRECAAWSAAPQDIDTLTRDQARLAWQLRTRLSPQARQAFDSLSPAIKLQLAELYTEVLAYPESVAHSG